MARRTVAAANRRWYTVVGVYTENWQKFCEHALGSDARDAEETIRRNPRIDADLVIVAVFEGRLMAVDQTESAARSHASLLPSLAMCWAHDITTRRPAH